VPPPPVLQQQAPPPPLQQHAFASSNFQRDSQSRPQQQLFAPLRAPPPMARPTTTTTTTTTTTAPVGYMPPTANAAAPFDRLDVVRFAEHQLPMFVEERRLGVFSYGDTTALLGVERVRVTVELSAADTVLLRAKTHRLHARLFTNDSPPEAPWTWAHQLAMNNVNVDVTQCVRKMRIKQLKAPVFLTPVPADLTATANANVNVISFQPSKTNERGIVVVQLVRVRTPADCVLELCKTLPSDGAAAITAGQSEADVKNTLRSLAQRSNASVHDDDVQEAAFIVSLVDPLALKRIEVPTRGKSCSHLQCFDLSTYVEYSCREQYWHCPVCGAAAPFASLVVDAHFATILAATAQLSDEKVIIERDGTYSRLPSEVDDNSSSESGDGRRKRLTSSKSTVHNILKTAAAPVLVLDDDSDEGGGEVPSTAAPTKAQPTTAQAPPPPPTTTTTPVAMPTILAPAAVVVVPSQPQEQQPPPTPAAATTVGAAQPESNGAQPSSVRAADASIIDYLQYLPRVAPPRAIPHAVPPVPVLRTQAMPPTKRARIAPGPNEAVIVLDSSE
jgi:hypothetical protein